MKLLVIGSDEIWSMEKHYCRYLKEAGADIQLFPAQSIFYDFYKKGFINKVLFKSGLSGIEKEIAARLKKKVIDFNPQVIWVFKGMEISPAILQWIKGQGVKLVNFNPDNPFIFSGSGSGNSNIARSIGIYDLHFSYDREVARKINQEYQKPCKILPFGFELDDKLYYECRQQQEIIKLCFIGNPDRHRIRFLQELANDIPIDIYGEGWADRVRHTNISTYPAVYGNEYWKTMYRYRIQLNLMRPHNPTSHNMRSFEVPGVGGIGLFPYTPDHVYYFEDGKEFFLYTNVHDCKKKCKEILVMSEEDGNKVRAAARRKSIEAKYTYRDRAFQALEEIKKLVA